MEGRSSRILGKISPLEGMEVEPSMGSVHLFELCRDRGMGNLCSVIVYKAKTMLRKQN